MFISKEQAQLNKELYIERLKLVITWKEFYEITKCVDPILTSEDDSKYYFFPKGGMKEYWDVRRQRAEFLSKLRDTQVNNYLSKLEGTDYEKKIEQLSKIKSDKYLSRADKSKLLNKYSESINQDYQKIA